MSTLRQVGVKTLFGRDIALDPRDRKYKLRKGRPRYPYRYWWSYGWHGNQGDEPSCVGYGWCHWLNAAPIRQWVNPSGVYQLCQFLDEWEGQDYDGTSVRAGAKVLSLLGAISEYRWAWDSETVANHILNTGPAVVGTMWYGGMHTPKQGRMDLTGDALGGHCYCLTGYNSRSGQFQVKNSFGKGWGTKGYAYLSEDDLQQLLDENGEACCGVERRLKP